MASESAEADDPLARPTEIEDLSQHVENVQEWGHFERGEGKTISVVVRDEDGEILGETYPLSRSGVYALVRVAREPTDPSEYEPKSAEPPEWVEFVYDDPPLDHFAVGARCSECDEESTSLRFIPGSQPHGEWTRIRHKGWCEHADEADEEDWPNRKQARQIGNRPSPVVYALGPLWREVEELQDLREEWGGETAQAVDVRLRGIGHVLRGRLMDRYPDCPECGHRLTHGERGGIRCVNYCEIGDEAREEYGQQAERVWGKRGHGGRSPREGDDG